MPGETRPSIGLRERKKTKTRTAIQQHALRLFRDRGYDATTVEQIADAAEVSPSTVFRYFPTKEDLVLHDDYDPILIAAFRAQPPGLGPIQAMRGAFRQVFSNRTVEELAEQRDRMALIFSVPELRARALDDFTATVQQVADLVAERVGRRPEDLAVRAFAGALIGTMFSVMLGAVEDPEANLVDLFDGAMAYLEAGLPL